LNVGFHKRSNDSLIVGGKINLDLEEQSIVITAVSEMIKLQS
jgi:hypothetical protein